MISRNPDRLVSQRCPGFHFAPQPASDSFFRTHYFDLHYLPHHIYNFCAVILFISMDRMPDIHTEDFRAEMRVKL